MAQLWPEIGNGLLERCARQFGTVYDEDLAEHAFAVDAYIIDHNAHCCRDEDCPATTSRSLLNALNHEMDRRVRFGISKPNPDRPTFEERHAPFGVEWELEQRERPQRQRLPALVRIRATALNGGVQMLR